MTPIAIIEDVHTKQAEAAAEAAREEERKQKEEERCILCYIML